MQNNIRLFFAGDFCSKPSTSQITVSTELRDLIQSCELKVVNFEVPLKPDVELPSQKRERFFQNDDVPDFLRELGFNLFSIANNHAFDWGEEGFKKTKAALGDAAFGAGTYDEAYKVKVVEKDGVKVGFLALSFAAYTGVFDDVTKHDGPGCAYINDLRVNHDIMEAKKKVDYLFILPHDGIEYIDVPLPETIARYRDFIDYGADGVIASHPHCPQGWEEYKGKPIFYSLGNFFFNSKETADFKCDKPHWYEGRCVVLTVDDKTISFEVINTLNRENVAIELDVSEESKNHNKIICNYLQSKVSYNNYFLPILHKFFDEDILVIDTTFHYNHIKQSFKALKRCMKNKIFKRKQGSDDAITRRLKNDLLRYRLIRGLEQNIIV